MDYAYQLFTQAPLLRWDNAPHYTKRIHERDGRVLRVVVNADVQPNRVVTVFFDRRLRQKTESTR